MTKVGRIVRRMIVYDLSLRVARIHFPVTALGPGRRLGLWVQGCGLACPGCMSRDTWDRDGGTVMTVQSIAAVWREAVARGAEGMTVSGGEPLDQHAAVAALLRQARAGEPGPGTVPDLLVYTGYELPEAQIRAPDVLGLADAVITGRYDVTRPTELIWRGSANQELVLLTGLGRERYQPFVEHCTSSPAVQLVQGIDGLWLIGLPRPGDLARMEHELRDRGISLSGVSWRPERAARLRERP